MFNQHRPLPIPSSFLINPDGTVSVIYKGPVESKQLSDDWARLKDSPSLRAQRITPFQGRWRFQPRVFYRTNFVEHLIKEGMLEESCDYVQQYFRDKFALPGRFEVIEKLIQTLRVHGKHDLADQLESDRNLMSHAPQS